LQLTITDVDNAPEDLYAQCPIVVNLIREMPGDDRQDYWLGEARTPIKWVHENRGRLITHLILAARWKGTRIATGARNLPVGIAFVTDQSLLSDSCLSFSKCTYVAIGITHDTTAGRTAGKNAGTLARTLWRLFSTRNQSG
jgi:hypothetical protein